MTMDTMRSSVEATPPKVLRLATTMVAQYLSGFVSELGEEVARRLGAVEVQWVLLPWDKLFSPDHAPFDMAMQLITITPERQAVVDFSDPVLVSNQGLLVRAESPIASATSLSDIRGSLLGAQGGPTTGMACIQQVINPEQPPRAYESMFLAAKGVSDGEIDGAVFPTFVALALSKQFRNTRVVSQFTRNEAHGILFDKGSPLRQPVNKVLAELKSDRSWSSMIDKWFPGIDEIPTFA